MTRTEWFKGIFPALVTPFGPDEEVDEDAFERLIARVLPYVDGLVPCGTTGEFSYLSDREKRRLIERAVEKSQGKPVIAGTGCPGTRETVALTEYAKEVGARAALVVTPFYLKPSYNEIYEHYEALNEIGLPLIMYNIPQCTGVHKRWWTAEGIAKLDNVIGIKDSSGDMAFMFALFEKVKEDISVFCGHDEIGMGALAAGADGLILASANLIPDVWREIYDAVMKRDLVKARRRQRDIQKLVRIVVRNGATQAVKEGLRMTGLPVGDSRRPIMPGGPFRREDREELRIQLEDLGKIGRRPVEFGTEAGEVITSDYPAIPRTPRRILDLALRVGEGFAGPPAHEVAHIDLLVGWRKGPVGEAVEEALGREGGAGRMIYADPKTLLVPTVTVRTKKQGENVYTHAAAGVEMALEKILRDGVIPMEIAKDLCLIVNLFVHPAAANRQRIKFNNYKAMLHAARRALEGRPSVRELLNEKECARHPFKYSP